MGTVKLEGTFRLDGLIEGPMFSEEDEGLIHAFVQEARKHGMRFHVSTDGGRFSVLPDAAPVRLEAGAASADALVAARLERWLADYLPEERARLMSTLRSVEYVPGKEKQTLYGIHPGGKVTVDQRVVDAETAAPASPGDWRAAVKPALLAAAAFGIIVGVSAFFVPYGDILAKAWRSVRPYDLRTLALEAGTYGEFLRVGEVAFAKRSDMIRITLLPLEAFPRTEAQFDAAWRKAGDSLRSRLALEALMRGYVTCEFYDADGAFVTHRMCRMHSTQTGLYILIPYDRNIQRVVIR